MILLQEVSGFKVEIWLKWSKILNQIERQRARTKMTQQKEDEDLRPEDGKDGRDESTSLVSTLYTLTITHVPAFGDDSKTLFPDDHRYNEHGVPMALDRSIFDLDLINCTSGQSTSRPADSSVRDVGIVRTSPRGYKAKQASRAWSRSSTPGFVSVYDGGVQRLAVESLLERQKWKNASSNGSHRTVFKAPLAVPPQNNVTAASQIRRATRDCSATDTGVHLLRYSAPLEKSRKQRVQRYAITTGSKGGA
ncbi:hypothetical protein C8R44DRAFT_754618 [Mycena epipterygia]|nr:hypothetical protein C8R44DRAFT_754618 [Mycena epipterygia]